MSCTVQIVDETDAIYIEQLELFARIGVTDNERAKPQRLVFSITLWPKTRFEDLEDDIRRSIDYSAVCTAAREFVEKRADKLIETMAAGLAGHLLKTFPLEKVRIELRKFVLPNAEYASVIVTRTAA